jgi:cold shock protein
MNYRDQFATCARCGKGFVFTVEKQRDLAESGRDVETPEFCEICTQEVKYGGHLHGRVKWFSLEKGYGFLAQDAGGEIFFHRQGIVLTETGSLPSLEEGQEVLYEVIDTPKGPQAVQVTPYSG